MIGQKELHDTLTGFVDEGCIGEDFGTGHGGHCTRSDGFGGAFDLRGK